MKKMSAFLMAVLMTALLCCTAYAAALTEDGIYKVSDSGILHDFKTSGSASVIAGAVVSGESSTFYADACRFTVERSGLTNGNQYILYILSSPWAPTTENIVYINQKAAASNKVVFTDAYPSAMQNNTTYYVYIVGADKTDVSKPLATFQYNRVTRFTLNVSLPASGVSKATVTRGGVSMGEGVRWTDAKVGSYTITATGMVSWSGEIQVTEGTEKTIILTASGDANGDGIVNVKDMQVLYNYLTTTSPEGNLEDDADYFTAVSDANGDNTINILDYQWIYDHQIK